MSERILVLGASGMKLSDSVDDPDELDLGLSGLDFCEVALLAGQQVVSISSHSIQATSRSTNLPL
jgi:hypothetical protein